MNHKYFLLSISFLQISIYLCIFFTPSVSSSQIICVYPQADTLSLWGTCTPPEIRCVLTNVCQDTDRIVIQPYNAELICGIPFGNITARFDSAYFQVRDSLRLNRYELIYINYSAYHSARFQLPFDSLLYSYGGHCALILRVVRDTAIIDSAVLRFDSYQTGLGVEENNHTLPNTPWLIQNFPNPFNPITTISFNISLRSFVTLKVFDLLGRDVATIVSEELSAGIYSRQWNANNIPSGIFFYRLQTGSYIQTKKLVLLK
jgi:hypothetical protein